MTTYLLDNDLQRVDILEGYESYIWTERYDEHGDLVIAYSLKQKRPSDFPLGWYIEDTSSEELMQIRSATAEKGSDKSHNLTIRGRALTTLLDQRIIWNQTNVDTSLGTATELLLNQNIIAPSNSARRIDNMVYAPPGATIPAGYNVKAQFRGQTLYTAISDMCSQFDVGFRVKYIRDTGSFRFQLYGGTNRSYLQSENSFVVFSPEFDNLENSSYLTSINGYTNAVLVGGEGEGSSQKTRTVFRNTPEPSGVRRFEAYHTAEGNSSNAGSIPAAQYNAQLDQEGQAFLAQSNIEHIFDGETDKTTSNGYGSVYHLGDIAQIVDEDLVSAPARIVEFIRSDDVNDGVQEFPALRVMNI